MKIERPEQIKSLAMLKMEKNFLAVIDYPKNHDRRPYEVNTNHFYWLGRIKEEYNELMKALLNDDTTNARIELADISNLVDYLYEILLHRDNRMHKPLLIDHL